MEEAREAPVDHFYSRPCGRGDGGIALRAEPARTISTHAPAGGATVPLIVLEPFVADFYSRPCGRGDADSFVMEIMAFSFLLTPLREGRLSLQRLADSVGYISTHAPAGGATPPPLPGGPTTYSFLLTPLREGRLPELSCFSAVVEISTHAPAGGATRR